MIPSTVFAPVKWRKIDREAKLLFFELWGLATAYDARGAFLNDQGQYLTDEDVCFELHYTMDFAAMVSVLVEHGFLARDDHGLYIPAFRQANPTTQAERRRKWVDSKRGKKVTATMDDPNVDEPPPDEGFSPDDEFSENSAGIPEENSALNVKVNIKSKVKSKSRGTGEPKDSESSDSAQSARKPDEFFDKLAEITHAEPKLQGSLIGRTKAQLLKVNATLQELDRFNAYWYAADFRGLKGQSPSLTQIVSEWGKAKAWNPNSPPPRQQAQPRNEPAGFANLRAAAGLPV